MRRFWRPRGIEHALRTRRREAPDEFVASVADRIAPVGRAGSPRTVLALALAIGVMVVMSALGGVGYASSAAHQVAATVTHMVSAPSHVAVTKTGDSSAGDMYCRGDDCEHHHHHHHHRHHHHRHHDNDNDGHHHDND